MPFHLARNLAGPPVPNCDCTDGPDIAAAQAMSVRQDQDPKGLEAKPASAVHGVDAPND